MEQVVAFVQVWIWPIMATMLIPLAVNLVSKCSYSGETKSLISLGFSIVVGILALLAAGLNLPPVVAIAAAFGGAQLSYLAFKRIGITNKWMEVLLQFGSSTSGVE